MQINYKILLTTFLLTAALLLTGCNTAAGFGKDLQQGGESIQKAVESSKYKA